MQNCLEIMNIKLNEKASLKMLKAASWKVFKGYEWLENIHYFFFSENMSSWIKKNKKHKYMIHLIWERTKKLANSNNNSQYP